MSAQQRPYSRLNRRPLVNAWYPFFVLGVLGLFWVYAHYIERVDVAQVTAWLQARQLGVLAALPYVPALLSFFHWKVLRHIVAV
ncbi:MAG: hypothetical protein WAS33_08350, partial [Candidatus Promineifilaceae bacterium]